MDKIVSFLKKNWQRLLFLVVALIALGLILSGLFTDRKTVYVLPDVKTDSLFTSPLPAEQSAEARWDSLQKIDP